MNKKKKTTLFVIGALLVISVITGISYALWSITRVQTNPNEISSGCFSLEMEDGSTLELSGAFPMTEEQAMKKEGYTFKLKNTCTIDAKVSIKLLVMNDSTMALNHVKANLNGDIVIPSKMLSSMENGTTITSDVTSTKVIGTVYVPGNTTKEYELRLWLDENVTTGEEQNTILNAKVEVEATTAMVYADASGANAPELNNGLIPVVYNEDKSSWEVADTYSEWYNYTEQKWANAVTVKESVRSNYTNVLPGTQIPMDDINTMWVWIPRYSYTIKSEDGINYYGNLNGEYIYCKDIENPTAENYPSCYEYEIDDENRTKFHQKILSTLRISEEEASELEEILFKNKYETTWYKFTLKKYLDALKIEYVETFKGNNYANYNLEQPAAIDIKFVSNTIKERGTAQYLGNVANEWYTHSAFSFGAQELSGLWMAKFEMSLPQESECATSSYPIEFCDTTNYAPEIKPNANSWERTKAGTYFTAIQNQMNGIAGLKNYGLTDSDAHMIKNTEWGAAAYLSQSKYGKLGNKDFNENEKKIYINNGGSLNFTITGCSAGDSTSDYSDSCKYTYDIEKFGTGASTSGTIYGIYDMNGGSYEYVMGIMREVTNTEIAVGGTAGYNSGFSGKLPDGTDYTGTYGYLKDIDAKYYDIYSYHAGYGAHGFPLGRAIKGDGTQETYAWYKGDSNFINGNCSWFIRGGSKNNASLSSSIFASRVAGGEEGSFLASRAVLVAAE